jgi:hypothetical protein
VEGGGEEVKGYGNGFLILIGVFGPNTLQLYI